MNYINTDTLEFQLDFEFHDLDWKVRGDIMQDIDTREKRLSNLTVTLNAIKHDCNRVEVDGLEIIQAFGLLQQFTDRVWSELQACIGPELELENSTYENI